MLKKDIKGLSLEELQEFLLKLGQPKYHARQIFSWIYQKGKVDFSQMTNLPAALRQILEENFFIASLELLKKLKSSDGTEKFLFRPKDGNSVEAVSIPTQERVTGCVSTQVGCKFSCRFCASGTKGFKRNLTYGEILEEALYLKNNSQGKKLTHLVFMGTGEPFDNYDNLLKAIRIINSPEGLNIGSRRITISTAGVIPGIEKLAKEGLQVELSVSLHAPDDKTRSLIMPVNKIYPLVKLIAACKEYIKKTNRQITFEYILIKGLNSDLAKAQELVKLLKGLNCKVNLIPCNPIKELSVEPPGKIEIITFQNCLLKSKVNVTLRRPRGKDIDAACGQLRLNYETN